ncbi:glycerophosphoryl diester phosphodiesterase membrane domain-containing protein [Streptomyces sp. NA04227]|uniref:glycerophosphoryl diester phosphodiesterase membrane domain-containing protein n=1 Tax=Streptomyces sp. NA04227 TaxID=2742136 RepID=UPI00158FED63|nr:glycerophosphoryl diester phosphodiesterase membrane domain-containing protein [Streptomyces sp. NA04227]QKW06832.1 glycerophosphoryl diester phosphodiesterase membrane domain-containing protein [Streptomyces sp. NA04227]
MNDSPGWASPGSSPSDGQEPGASDGQEPGASDGQEPGASGADAPSGSNGPSSKWSGNQPPPGQWTAPGGQSPQGNPPPPPAGWGSAPGGPPPGAPGGWGGQGGGPGWGGGPAGPGPGWGGGPGFGGWGGPPPAAKPGVIPLRPLGVGEILDGAVATMRKHWRTVLGIALAVAVVTEVAVVLLQGLYLNDLTDTSALEDESASLEEVTDAMGEALLGSGIVLLISLLGTIVATALLTTVTSRAVIGRSVSTAQAWQDARPQVLRLLGLTLLLPLIALTVVLVGMLPGILVAATAGGDGAIGLMVLGGIAAGGVAVWLTVRFSLASPALMLEKQSIGKAMRRSVKLVQGSWWRVFGILVLGAIIANVLTSIIVIPFTLIAGAVGEGGVDSFLSSSSDDYSWTFLIVQGVGSVIGTTLSLPISAGVTVLLYIDQRIRREALDLELGRAAGVQGYTGS